MNMDIRDEIGDILLNPYTKRERIIISIGSIVIMTPILLLFGISVPAFAIGTIGYHTGMYHLIKHLNKKKGFI